MPRRHYSSAAPLLPLPLLIILVPTTALILLLSLLCFSSHVLRPISVKKGWDSLNVLLVLFAVLCGIFARRTKDELVDEVSTSPYSIDQKTTRNSVMNDWIDDRYYNTRPTAGGGDTGRLKRNSSSYPDLRQESAREIGDNRFRFFDDFDLSKYRSPEADILNFHRHGRQGSEIQDEPKEIPVDTFVLRSYTSPPSPSKSPAQPPPPPPPPLPPPSARQQKQRRANRSIGHRQKVENSSDQCNAGLEEITSPPPPPPPPPPIATVKTEQKYSKSGRKMSDARKEIKMALASLYSQTKRRNKLKRKSLSDDYSDHAPKEPVYSTRPPPSPPPPPPPSIFHSIFRKGGKSKRIHSFSAPPPPPPPPPRSTKPESQTRPPPPPPKAPPTRPPELSHRRPTGRPPFPTRTDQCHDETLNNGGESPLIPMPPPPPPFEMPKTKFVIRGDFVRIRSTHSSRCSSPELDDVDVSSIHGNPDTVNAINGGDRVIGSVFCPSPDVNIKAETFIARLRDGWRFEKMNSVKENRNLDRGPDPGPGPGPSMRG